MSGIENNLFDYFGIVWESVIVLTNMQKTFQCTNYSSYNMFLYHIFDPQSAHVY